MEQRLKELLVVNVEGRQEVRAYFANGRAHAITVSNPHGPTELATALHILAEQIMHDQHLRSNA